MKLQKNSHSQSGQESFVLNAIDFKHEGTYLEIGAWDGLDLSNTYLLESEYNWRGVALDNVEKNVTRYNKKRINKCLLQDALFANYEEILRNLGFPGVIDYLQLDIEPAENTFNCLMRIPFDKFKFRVITYEHDLYASAENYVYKDKAFKYLSGLGYTRVANNVQNLGNPYEDWYVYESLLPRNPFVTLESNTDYNSHFTS